jgi:hypothetical protein
VKNNPSYTWDVQMQYTSFLFDFTNLAPVFRFSDNEGFNDIKATHTKDSQKIGFLVLTIRLAYPSLRRLLINIVSKPELTFKTSFLKSNNSYG